MKQCFPFWQQSNWLNKIYSQHFYFQKERNQKKIITCKHIHIYILFDHIIRKSKLFLVQIKLEMADIQNHCGSRGSWYVKKISGVQRWILNNKIILAWGRLDSLGCCLQSWDSGLPLRENFDEISLTGAEIFAFEICLENFTNIEEKNSVLTRFIYLMMLISARS